MSMNKHIQKYYPQLVKTTMELYLKIDYSWHYGSIDVASLSVF